LRQIWIFLPDQSIYLNLFQFYNAPENIALEKKLPLCLD